jgi:hypothetical protein
MHTRDMSIVMPITGMAMGIILNQAPMPGR